MAVQAQYLSNAFSPDFRARIQSDNVNVFDELHLQHPHLQIHGGLNSLIFNNNNNNNNNNDTAAFSNPQSELTCNVSGSKKRNRDQSPSAMAHQQFHQTPIRYNNYIRHVADPSVSTAIQLPMDQTLAMIESTRTSTSGRSSGSLIGQDLISQFYNQSLEIDNLVRLQNERLRLGLEETRKRHCRSLISVLEQQVMKKLKEKEAELENASRKNLELEDRIRQMSAENQIWFNVAKNNEAIVSSLKMSLEQVLLQNTVNDVQAKEGYGDSDGTPFPADDSQSCCFEGVEERTNGGVSAVKAAAVRGCRVCGGRDVSVLLLPCRHLCLCKDCESKVDTCPICNDAKKACLQIFMS